MSMDNVAINLAAILVKTGTYLMDLDKKVAEDLDLPYEGVKPILNTFTPHMNYQFAVVILELAKMYPDNVHLQDAAKSARAVMAVTGSVVSESLTFPQFIAEYFKQLRGTGSDGIEDARAEFSEMVDQLEMFDMFKRGEPVNYKLDKDTQP